MQARARFGGSRAVAAAERLVQARRELAEALQDLRGDGRSDLLSRIRQAQTMHELWHLRPEVFKLVSLELDQNEAVRRLAVMNRHFPVRAPRPGARLPSAARRNASRANLPL